MSEAARNSRVIQIPGSTVSAVARASKDLRAALDGQKSHSDALRRAQRRELPTEQLDGSDIENLDQLAVAMDVSRKAVPFYVLETKEAPAELKRQAAAEVRAARSKRRVRKHKYRKDSQSGAGNCRVCARSRRHAVHMVGDNSAMMNNPPGTVFDAGSMSAKARVVRSEAGARRYGKPVGSVIGGSGVTLKPTGHEFNPAITEHEVQGHNIKVPEDDGWITRVLFEQSSSPDLNHRIVVTQQKPPIMRGMRPFTRDVGRMSYHPETGRVEGIQTHDNFQRMGVATGMWNLAKQLHKQIGIVRPQHSENQFAEGAAWARSVGKVMEDEARERKIQQVNGEVPTGVAVMAFVHPQDAEEIALPGGEAPRQLHVTLGYLKQPAAEYTDSQRQQLITKLATAARLFPVTADSFATATFNPDSDERDPCAVLLVQSKELSDAHEAVAKTLGAMQSDTFPVWIPHVALKYDTTNIPVEHASRKIRLDRLILGWGPDAYDCATGANIEEGNEATSG